MKTHNIILTVNPSHAHTYEDQFWKNVASVARSNGLHLIEVASRNLPFTHMALSFSIPARLSDINLKLRNLPIVKLLGNIDWITEDEIFLLEDWEYRRWQISQRSPAVLLGILRLIVFVDSVIRHVKPAVILTTNKIDNIVYLFRKAAIFYAINTYVVERSPLDSIWLEPNGIFTESNIWHKYRYANNHETQQLVKKGNNEIKKIQQNPYGFRKESINITNVFKDIKKLNPIIFFLPMDNVLWTGWGQEAHPMNYIDNPLFANPVDAIETINRYVRNLNGILVVKTHPSCVQFQNVKFSKSIVFIDDNLDDLFNLSDVIITFNTKLAFVGLAYKKPVVTLAPNPAAASGSTYHCLAKNNIEKTLNEALSHEDLKQRLNNYQYFIGWLSTKYFYKIDIADRQCPGPYEFVQFIKGEIHNDFSNCDLNQNHEIIDSLTKLCSTPPKTPQTTHPSVLNYKALIVAIKAKIKKIVESCFRDFMKNKTIPTSPSSQQYRLDWKAVYKSLSTYEYQYFMKLWHTQCAYSFNYGNNNFYSSENYCLSHLKGKYVSEKKIYIVCDNISNPEILQYLSGKTIYAVNFGWENYGKNNLGFNFFTLFNLSKNNDSIEMIILNKDCKFILPNFYIGLFDNKNEKYIFNENFIKYSMAFTNSRNQKLNQFDDNYSVFIASQICSYIGFDKIYVVMNNSIGKLSNEQ